MGVRKRILFMVLVILALAGRSAAAQQPVDARLASMDMVAEGDTLALYIDRTNTDVAVHDKRTGRTWYSNPPGQPALSISYWNQVDELLVMNTSKDSVPYGQFEVTDIDGGVRVDYRIGREWKDADYVPVVISAERMNEVISQLSSSDQKAVLDAYTEISLVDRGSEPPVEISGLNIEKLLGPYKVVSSDPKAKTTTALWALLRYVRDWSDGVPSTEAVTLGHIRGLVDTPTYVMNDIPAFTLNRVIKAFKSAGFTPQSVTEEHERYGLKGPSRSLEVFGVSIEYAIDGDDFVVRIPVSDVTYPFVDQEAWITRSSAAFKVKATHLPLSEINVLPYFGCGTKEEQGYAFVPDGPGALLRFVDRAGASKYGIRVYGLDMANLDIGPAWQKRLVDPVKDAAEKVQAYLPVFGLKRGDSAFFAIIEDGDALARIVADVSSSFKSVYGAFTVTPNGKTSIAKTTGHEGWGAAQINVYQSRMYQGDIRVRYAFLEGENADYVGMAHHYQSYLLERGALTKKPVSKDLPFFLQVVGAITARRSVFGIVRNIAVPVTTYEQAIQIVEELSAAGVSNIQLEYLGWTKGGIRHYYPSKVHLEPVLGGRAEFDRLRDYLKARGMSFYPDISLINVYVTSLFDGFTVSGSSARRPDRMVATIDDDGMGRYVLSPGLVDDLIDSFLPSYRGYGIDALSPRFLGQQLSSDFREDPQLLIDRQQSRQIMEEQLKRLRVDSGMSLMLSGVNAYALPYADVVVDMPLSCSSSNLLDESVPFYPIVLHGYIPYAGEPVNLAGDYRRSILQSVEAGASLHYELFFSSPSVVKDTPFNYLFGAGYRDWLEEAAQLYEQVNALLGQVQDQRIVGHRKVMDDVYETTYEDGTRVLVNYGRKDVVIGDVRVAAMDFAVYQGGNHDAH
ncbi:MAG: hypothetical protein GXX08_00285 [Firmicutes bacterium]|nr:hypothetical protein [Bacillota bacterium]